ncbi:MAG: hypothetical protein ACRER5_02945 [Pseudomonas sp.]
MRGEIEEHVLELIAEAALQEQDVQDFEDWAEWFEFNDSLPTHTIDGFGEVSVHARMLDLFDPDQDEASSCNSVYGLSVQFELGGEPIGELHALVIDARDLELEEYVLPFPPLRGWASTFMNEYGELRPAAERVWSVQDGESVIQGCCIKFISLAPAFQSQALFEYTIRTALWLAHSVLDATELPPEIPAVDPRAWRITVDAPTEDQQHICDDAAWRSVPTSNLVGLRACLAALGAERADGINHGFGEGTIKPCSHHADVYLLPDLNAPTPEPGRASWRSA